MINWYNGHCAAIKKIKGTDRRLSKIFMCKKQGTG